MTPTFDNSYAALPSRFYTRLLPEEVPGPRVVRVNDELAELLGFDPDWLRSDAGAAFATGNEIIEGSDPIATVYAGHQFGGWNPQLGDGRAILLGEVIGTDERRYDIQLKGSGRTPYSRRGDGRSPLGPVLREYVISETMHALGIPTTRSLVAATTGAEVRRETMQPGGVLVRVAASHIRVGTFEYFAARNDGESIRLLANHVGERHFDGLVDAPAELFAAAAERQAKLIAQWMLVGFIHGVMNTDNMLVSGETIDYGPCAFMNEYDPETVYSSIDHMGRYAYGNQPPIARWNLSRFATSLLVGWEDEDAARAMQRVVDDFPDRFKHHYGAGLANKLGFELREDDWPLLEGLLQAMYDDGADYTNTFRALNALAEGRDDVTFGTMVREWLPGWRERIETEPDAALTMARHNPLVIPRNHQVERAIRAAVNDDDFSVFHRLVDVVTSPFDLDPDDEHFTAPPAPDEKVHATFCGT